MIRPRLILVLSSVFFASFAVISAHPVRSVTSSPAKAFVSSPTSANDALVPLLWVNAQATPPATYDTGLRVMCFFVANPSLPDPARPDWPRITSVGFELPGASSGFALIEPAGGEWRLTENLPATLSGHDVTLDFAIVSDVNPTGRTPGQPKDPLGIPPGQPEITRGAGMRFCVSGPFPAQLTKIEDVLNGVVVGFHGVDGNHQGVDAGVWLTQGVLRPIPLY